MAEFRISILFQYFMNLLAWFNTFSRSWKPLSKFNTFSILSIPRGNPVQVIREAKSQDELTHFPGLVFHQSRGRERDYAIYGSKYSNGSCNCFLIYTTKLLTSTWPKDSRSWHCCLLRKKTDLYDGADTDGIDWRHPGTVHDEKFDLACSAKRLGLASCAKRVGRPQTSRFQRNTLCERWFR